MTFLPWLKRSNPAASPETEPFLRDPESGELYNDYGSNATEQDNEDNQDGFGDDFGNASSDESDDDEDMKEFRKKRLKETGGYLGYLRDFSIFVPMVFPRKNRTVQLCVFLNVAALLAERALNVLIPRQLGIVTNQAMAGDAPWQALLIWFAMSVAGGEAGIQSLQRLVRIPIQQASYRAITAASFDHILTLSMEYHVDNDSAEVIKAIEQGNSAIVQVLESLVTEIFPTVMDVVVAATVLTSKFNYTVALALLVAAVTMITAEATLTRHSVHFQRVTSSAERYEARLMFQSVQGWETVTYFGAATLQRGLLGAAIDAMLKATRRREIFEAAVQASLGILSDLAMLCLCGLVLREVVSGRASVGDFVFVLYYWDYLIWPLKFLSRNYRYLLSDLVNAERLLRLLRTEPTVVSMPGAINQDPAFVQGQVEFENVSFGYRQSEADTTIKSLVLHDLNLKAAPGETIAIVGETGAGKSSLTRLLLRLYDPTDGRILLDGRDIRRDISLPSLRRAVGIVPQHPFLFDTTILDNVRFARPSATDDEVREACRAADIDERIMAMPNRYNTAVGERGIKLSGGEAQRLALARIFLSKPPVLVLDEATSSVDTVTESHIQTALERACKGRTTFVIAHRLSTVVGADRIVVLHHGEIVEQGTHSELLKKGGRYQKLWTEQFKAGGKEEEEE